MEKIANLEKQHQEDVELMKAISRYFCGGHYEPRNNEEAELSKKIIDKYGI